MPDQKLKEAIQYLEGLDTKAENLEKIISGSTLNNKERAALLDIWNYLITAPTAIKDLRIHERFYQKEPI